MAEQLFSQRNGYKQAPSIQLEEMDSTLRERLWNVLQIFIFHYKDDQYHTATAAPCYSICRNIWLNFFKFSVNTIDRVSWKHLYESMYLNFVQLSWDEVYSFIEYVLRSTQVTNLVNELNRILEEENSGYRIIDNHVVPITDANQLTEIEATQSISASGVKAHITRALELLSDRKNPDYRNSVKESISAVEAMARSLTEKKSATLGDLVDIIDNKSQTKLHGAFKEAFKKLYGYTSDEKGIRHSLLEQKDISSSDAMFMLVVCSAFVNLCERTLGKIV